MIQVKMKIFLFSKREKENIAPHFVTNVTAADTGCESVGKMFFKSSGKAMVYFGHGPDPYLCGEMFIYIYIYMSGGSTKLWLFEMTKKRQLVS